VRAKCPYCTSGCGRCDGGSVEVLFAGGDVYGRVCRACGRANGARVAGPGLPPLPPRPDPCVFCGSPDAEWRPAAAR
jgi:hypothetical protein